MNRVETTQVKIKNLVIGGQNKVVIQTMCTYKTSNVEQVVKQILELEVLGCELIRVSVLDKEDALAIKEIKKQIHIPLVADIHFDYKLALLSIDSGADKIRLNPGNLTSEAQIKEIIDACKEKNIPIRIGVNSGSINPLELKKNDNKLTVSLMLDTLDKYINIFKKYNFDNLVLALKSSDPLLTLEAYREASKRYNYPLHIGVTETSYKDIGLIKSSICLVPLLLEGIGDTMRISLSDDPKEEVLASKRLLHEVGLYPNYHSLISCPTCGRTNGPVTTLCRDIDALLEKYHSTKKVAIMGCVVNGVGEGKASDIGFAFVSKDEATVFIDGKIIKTLKKDEILPYLEEYLKNN